MKTKIKNGLIALTLILLVSCDSWIDPNLNIDPTSPRDVSMNVVLPTTQAAISYVAGGDFYRQLGLFTQHFTGYDRQHLGYYNYQLNENTFENAWNTMYSGPMNDLYILIKKAQELESPHYGGIAKILMAYSLGMISDAMGDIPYSEAFKGVENLKPKYDNQERIYNSIDQLLSSAIQDLSNPKSAFKPGGDDFIYKGNTAKWIKAAYTLKARYYLHVKKFNEALDALKNGFTDNTDDLQFNHGAKESESNPLYQFMQQRGDIYVGTYLINMMNDLNDPRRSAFAEADDEGNFTETSFPGPFYASINSPVPFITYAEAKFIEAEIHMHLGNKSLAYTTYIEAITASCKKFGIADDDINAYINQESVGLGGDDTKLTLEHIMNQKYIAMYYNSESWTDWRRTGFPQLTPIRGDKIPRRVFYPQSEQLYNRENLMAAAPNYNLPIFIFEKLWWDKTFWNP